MVTFTMKEVLCCNMLNERRYMKNIVELPLSGYKFVLYYAELLNQGIAEFPHNHPMYEVYFVLEGTLIIDIAGQKYTIEAGQACILAKDIKHHVYYNPDVPKQYFAVIFDLVPCERLSMNGPDGPLEFSDVQQALRPVNAMGFHMLQSGSDAERIVRLIQSELIERRLGWNTQAVLLCYQFVIRTLRQIDIGDARDQQFAGRENLAMSVSMYIHKHYPENMSVESASEALNISPRHLNRAYKAMFSTTFMRNANLLRIAYAKNFLCKTDDSIDSIAEKIGFTSSRVL